MRRAEADVYAAQIDESLVMKIGGGSFQAPSGFVKVDGGDSWTVWTRG